MASKITIDATIDDKGTLSRFTLMAKKAGSALGGVAKSAMNTDRNMKGVGQQSSNSTKNFSKMAQGISGSLVPAYATLAANVFALSAAFEFLKSAGTLRTLKEGQVAYAAATGVGLRSLTEDIIAATDSQINFQDASQAAAIGISAGLSADQLTRLGKSAKDASLILGRDVPDSFNRLVRGVTKAEPELLDELGIILRLKDATEAYALTVNKAVGDLTPFERSQAVANDVLAQSEEKYSRILDIIAPSTNEFVKMGKAMNDLINTMKEWASFLAGPFAKAISGSPVVGAAVFGLLAKSILSTFLPTERWGKESAKASKRAAAGYRLQRIRLKALVRTQAAARLGATELAVSNMQAAGIPKSFKGAGFQAIRDGDVSKLTSRQVKRTLLDIEKTNLMTEKAKVVFRRELGIIEGSAKKSSAVVGGAFTNMWAKAKLAGSGTMLVGKGIKSIGSSLASILPKLLGWLGWISVAVIAFTTVKDLTNGFWGLIPPIAESSKEAQRAEEKITSLSEEFEHFNEVQKEIVKDGGGLISYYASLGNRIGTLSRKINATSMDAITTRMAEKTSRWNPMAGRAMAGYKKDLTAEGPMKNFLELNKNLAANLEISQEAFGAGSSKIFNDYLTQVDNLTKAIESKDVFGMHVARLNMESMQVGVQELTATFSGIVALTQANRTQTQSLIQGFLPESKEINQVTALNAELAEFAIIQAQSSTWDDKGRIAELNKEKDLFEKLDAQKKTAQLRDGKAAIESINNSIGKGKYELALLKFTNDGIRLTNRQKIAEEALKNIRNELFENNDQRQHAIDTQDQELQLIIAQTKALKDKRGEFLLIENLEELKRQRNAKGKLDATIGGIGLSADQSALLDFETKRLELRDKLKDVDAARLLLIGKTAINEQAALEDTEKQLQAEIKALKQKKEMHILIKALETSKATRDSSLKIAGVLGNIGLTSGQRELFAFEIKRAELVNSRLTAQAEITRLTSIEGTKDQVAIDAENIKLALYTAQTAELARQASTYWQVADAANQALETGLSKGISDLIKNKEGSLKDSIRTLAVSVLESMADTLARQITDTLMKHGGALTVAYQQGAIIATSFISAGTTVAGMIAAAMSIGGASSSITSSIVGSAISGATAHAAPGPAIGIMRQPIKPKGYASGGIADGPDSGHLNILHGKEAVVPLPNGNSIPVDLKGSSSNITINIDANGSSSGGGGDMDQLGKAVAGAVQRELQNQKRAGGILSPYGAS